MAKDDTARRPREFQRRTSVKALGYGRFWCAECERLSSMVTVNQASALTEISVDALIEQMSALHFRRRQSGALLICLDSLVRTYGQSH